MIRSANPAGGGPIEVVRRVGAEHVARGRQVEVVTLDAPDAPWLEGFPFPIHALGPVRTNYGYSPRLLPWLLERAGTFDLVIVNGLWQYSSFGVWRALRHTTTPYAVFPHGMLDPWFKQRYPLKHLKKWLYWPWAEYRVLRDAAVVLFTSEDERRLARESFWLYECKERVINYGTAPAPAPIPGENQRFLQSFPALTGKRLLVFLGRIHEKKGCDLLIQAFGRAVSTRAPSDPWHLVMAGPAATDRYLRKLQRLAARLKLSDRITWTGMLSGESKWAALRAADAFVLPSHQENFGVAVAEALACGTPALISTKVNIWREILSEGAGLADSDDQEGTDRLLQNWMSLEPSAQQRMRRNALRAFNARFDIRETATRLAQVLEELS